MEQPERDRRRAESFASTPDLRGILIATALGFAACSSPDSTGVNTDAISLSLSAAALTLEKGTQGAVNVTIAREGGFAGAVDVTVEGVPFGISATAAPASIPAGTTSSVITVNASAGAQAGGVTLTVRATGAGVASQSRTLQLTVTEPAGPAFSISSSPSTLVVGHGARASTTATIGRTGGQTGEVVLSASGVPAGVVVSFNPTTTSGTNSAISVTVGAGVPANSYPITIRGQAAGLADRTTVLTLTVPNSGTDAGSTTYRMCNALFAARQDGNGPWQVVPIVNNSATFTLSTGRGAIAWVTSPTTAAHNVTIIYGTRAELNNGGAACPTNPLRRSLSGSVANLLDPAVRVDIALASALGSATSFPSSAFTIHNVPVGMIDLFAALQSVDVNSGTLTTTRGIIRRALNPTGSTLPVLNFDAFEAFTPVNRTVTLANTGGDVVAMNVVFATNVNSPASAALLIRSDGVGSSVASRQYPTVPVTQPNDLHIISAVSSQTVGSSRSVLAFHREGADRTLALGPVIGTVGVTTGGSVSNIRPRVQYTVQSAYNRAVDIQHHQAIGGTTRTWNVSILAGYMGANTVVDHTIPDFSALAGWSPNWNIVVGEQLHWELTATGGDLKGENIDGSVIMTGTASGTRSP